MKKTILFLLGALAAFSTRAHAMHGEFGGQETWPAVTAANDLTGYQYRVMRFAAGETCNIASNAVSADKFEAPAGILQNNPSSGRAATIAFFGPSKAVAGAAVAARKMITTDGSGMVIEAVSGNLIIGRSIEATAAALEVFSVMLFPAVRGGSVA